MWGVEVAQFSFEEMLQQRLGPNSFDGRSKTRMEHPLWQFALSGLLPPQARPTAYTNDCYTVRVLSHFDDLETDAAALLLAAGSPELNIQELKKLRRNFVWRYHPDRIRDLKMREMASRALSEVNAAVDAALKSGPG